MVIVSEWLLLGPCVLFGSSCCVLGCVSWVLVGGNRVVKLIGIISMHSECSSTSWFVLSWYWLELVGAVAEKAEAQALIRKHT